MIYLRQRSTGISLVKQMVAGDKTGSEMKRQDFTPRRTPFLDEREQTGRLEANQIAMRPGAKSDLYLSFMAALAAYMPRIKTGSLCAGK